jgi:phage-related protein
LKSLGLDFKQVENDINAGGESAQKAFMAVVTAIASVKNPADRAHTAIALMGTPLEDLGPEFRDFFATVNTDLGEFTGATDRAGEALKGSFGEQAKSLFRELMVSLLPLGEILLDVAKNIMPVLQGAIASFSDTLANMSPGMQTAIVVIGGLAAALGPLLIIIGQIATGISSMISIFTAVSGAIAAAGGASAVFGSALAAITGPIGIAVAAIAGLVAGIAVLYNKNEEFRKFADEVWAEIKDIFVQAWEEIVAFVKPLIEDLSAFFKDIFTELQAFWKEHGELIMVFVNAFLKTIAGYFRVQFEAIKTVVSVAWTLIKAIITTVVEAIKLIISNFLDIVRGGFQVWSKLLQGDWKGAWEAIKDTAKNIMDNIVTFFKNIDLVQVGKDIIQGLINGISSMASAVSDKVKEIADGVKNGIKNALDIHSPSRVMEELGKFTGEGFALGLDSTIQSIKDGANNMAAAAQTALQGVSAPSTDLSTGAAGSIGANTYSFADMFRGAVFNVRNDNDIKLIGQELGNVITQNTRALGGA